MAHLRRRVQLATDTVTHKLPHDPEAGTLGPPLHGDPDVTDPVAGSHLLDRVLDAGRAFVATSEAVPTPYSSAPSMAAITTSRPVFSPPSVCSTTRLRRSFMTSV